MATKKILVKTMLMSILTVGTMMSFTACSSDDAVLDEVNNSMQSKTSRNATAERTVLVYLAGKNNLSESLQTNLEQMNRLCVARRYGHQHQQYAGLQS